MPTLTIPRTLVTAAEFARMPNPREGSRQELVCGEVITMPPTGFAHGLIQVEVTLLLGAFVREHLLGLVTANSGIITSSDPDSVRGPDIAFWTKERLPQGTATGVYPIVPPDLCVTVIPPGNRPRRMQEKIADYFAHGVRMVWLIHPEMRTVTVYRSAEEGRTLWEDAELTGEDVIPGFRCRIAQLFETLPTAALPQEPPLNGAH